MKKETGCNYLLYIVCITVMLSAGCDAFGGRPEKVYGTVIAVDAAKKEVVLTDDATGKERTITVVSADQLAALKPGMAMKARVKRGTHMAEKAMPRVRRGGGRSAAQKPDEG